MKQLIVSLLGVFLFCLNTVVVADDVHPAQQRVEQSVNSIFNILKAEREKIQQDRAYQDQIVAKYVTPYLDFEGMSKLAVGKNWRIATPNQQQQLIQEFKTLLLNTYTKSLAEYSDQSIQFKPFRTGDRDDRANVFADILQTNGPSIPMQFRLRLVGSEWLVYDIAIDGISLVTTYRTSFTTEINRSGVEGLIASLAKKNSGGS
ncbi:MAG TPA: toluene tolerance protein [Gammaproteobacteria bacterium]|nr:toluene tolerance protein [Gammaproteobacteria bacterium]HCO61340.1 toluene tolerance protein [Porticoccaceae bacterium]